MTEHLVLLVPGQPAQAFTLKKPSVTIGRAVTNDVVLRDPAASRSHARLERTASGWEVLDLGSANGLKVNGARVDRAALGPEDAVTVGDSTLRVVASAEDHEPESTPDLDRTILGERLAVRLQDTTRARLAIVTPGRTWEVAIDDDTQTIGRHEECGVQIESPEVSRRHAVIERRGPRFVLKDLGSRNGTWMRGQPLASPVTLEDGASFAVGPARLVFKQGFAGDDLAVHEPFERQAASRPSVVIVPGFGGSQLWLGGDQVWPSPATMLSAPELLDISQPLEVRGLVDEVVIVPNLIKQDHYSALTEYLEENLAFRTGRDLLEFAYDFRQDNRESARRLAAAVDAWDVPGPITIVAHSMGCMVARYYLEMLGGDRRVTRAIYLGGPHAGTPYAFASLLEGPDLLPLGLFNDRFRVMLAGYPSWYQILPTYACVSDARCAFEVLEDESWVQAAHRPLLRSARAFRRELARRPTVPSVCVFGYGLKTVTSAQVERDDGCPCRSADFVTTAEGDGMIPEPSAVMPDAEIHPVKQYHGSLYSDGDVQMRLKHELVGIGRPG